MDFGNERADEVLAPCALSRSKTVTLAKRFLFALTSCINCIPPLPQKKDILAQNKSKSCGSIVSAIVTILRKRYAKDFSENLFSGVTYIMHNSAWKSLLSQHPPIT